MIIDKIISNKNDLELDKHFFNLIQSHNILEIKLLLSKNLNLPIWEFESKENSSILHVCVKLEQIDIINLIFTHLKSNLTKPEITSFVNKETSQGITALHYASFQGKISIITILLEYGADYNKVTKKQLNVLHYAAQGNQPNSIVYFHEIKKIDISSPDHDNSTPLHWASFSFSEDAVYYLLYYGADINAQDSQGLTPLHLAVMSNNIQLVKKLLQRGADIKLKDNNKKEGGKAEEGRTAKDLAEENGFKAIYEVIKRSEGCRFGVMNAPNSKMKKNSWKPIIVIAVQVVTTGYFYFLLWPFIMSTVKDNKEENGMCGTLEKIQFFYLVPTIIFIIVYLMLIFSNPGRNENKNKRNLLNILMGEKNNKEEDLRLYCPECKVKKKRFMKHCIICNVCIDDFDHHCYWVNNCIGEKNYKGFFGLLYVSAINLALFIGSVIFGLAQWITMQQESDVGCEEIITLFFNRFSPWNFVLIFCALIVGIFFFIPLILLIILHTNNCIYNSKLKKIKDNRDENNILFKDDNDNKV